MFYYVSGTVAHVEPYLAVIDCGGVGYACKTTSTTISQLQVGKASKLYTYLHVGEGIFDLYGFATQGELGSFKQLIGPMTMLVAVVPPWARVSSFTPSL